MFEKLNIDWDLLHRQKLALFALLSRSTRTSRVKLTRSEREAIEGIVNLLDALQDDAVAGGSGRSRRKRETASRDGGFTHDDG